MRSRSSVVLRQASDAETVAEWLDVVVLEAVVSKAAVLKQASLAATGADVSEESVDAILIEVLCISVEQESTLSSGGVSIP